MSALNYKQSHDGGYGEYADYERQMYAEDMPGYDDERFGEFQERMSSSAAPAAHGDTPGGARTKNAAPALKQSAAQPNLQQARTVVIGTPIAHKWSSASMYSGASAAGDLSALDAKNGEVSEKKKSRWSKTSQSAASAAAVANGMTAKEKKVGKKVAFDGDAASASFNPLHTALQHHNLSTEEQFNVRSLHVQSAVNNSPHPIKVQVGAVNGENIKGNVHEDGSWSSIMLAPHEHKSFTSLNDGKGMFLGGKELGPVASINLMSKSNLLDEASVHNNEYDDDGLPKAYRIKLNLKELLKGSHGIETHETLHNNPLSDVVFTNAFPVLIKNKQFAADLDHSKLQPYYNVDTNMLPSAQIAKDPFASEPGQYDLKVDGNELRKVVDTFKKNNMAEAQRTSASAQHVTITRMDKEAPLQDGNVHVQLFWELQHNGREHKK